MSEFWEALILGVVQGLTEFLPISSTAHLIIVPEIFGWEGVVSTLSFDLALHFGTSLAVIIFFWNEWVRLIVAFIKSAKRGLRGIWSDTDARIFLFLLVGSIPAGIAGFFFESFVEETLRSTSVVAVSLIVFALLLWYADRLSTKKEMGRMNLADSLIIGTFQAIALIPGVSRSGATISGGLFRGLDRFSATKFSFLLSTPIILAASLFEAKDVMEEGSLTTAADLFLVGFVASLISGIIAIKFLLAFVQKNTFTPFIIYRILLGIILLIFVFLRS